MAGAAPRGRTSSATKNAAIIPGNSHRRQAAVFAWPGGPGWDMGMLMLLLLPGGTPGGGPTGSKRGLAGVWRPGRDHRDWLYSGARCTTGRDSAGTLAAWIRACQAPAATSRTSRMITDSTLSAAMP